MPLMPEKTALPVHSQRAMTPRWRSPRTAILLSFLFLAALWHIYSTNTNLGFKHTTLSNNDKTDQAPLRSDTPVQLEAHIMSKCPDAADCLAKLILPSMSRLAPDHVNLTLSYIGTTSPHDDGVTCPHGPDECLGDMIQLCAASMYPDPKQYLGFAYCMEQRLEDIPKRALVQECSAEYGIDFGRLNDCVSREDGSVGLGLLWDSVERTREAGVTKSCTVRVEEKIWCIRDGGAWVDCKNGDSPEDLIKVIEKLYRTKNT